MKRTLCATLRFLREDLVLPLAALPVFALLGVGLGVLAALLDTPQDAPLAAAVVMLLGGVLLTVVLSIVYFSNWFAVLLAFPANRRGLLAGLLLFCLGVSALAQLAALAVGSLCTLGFGAAFGQPLAMPWQQIPAFVWPCCLLGPVLGGVVLGGLQCRFGAAAFWVVYFVFLGVCSTASWWLPVLTDRFSPTGLAALGAGAGLALLLLAALAVRWLLRAAVKA